MKFWRIEEAGGLVRIDRHNLPDLDDLMLDVLMHPEVRERLEEQWEEQTWPGDEEDRATAVPDCDRWYGGEAVIGFYRTNPCTCGEEHSFDMASVDMSEDGEPTGRGARGSFMAVFFR